MLPSNNDNQWSSLHLIVVLFDSQSLNFIFADCIKYNFSFIQFLLILYDFKAIEISIQVGIGIGIGLCNFKHIIFINGRNGESERIIKSF